MTRKSSRHMKRGLKVLRNLVLDLRFGGFFGKTVHTPYERLGAIAAASTDYAVLPHIFRSRIGPHDVLVDVGCGRGRVIRWLAGQGYGNRMIGVELDRRVAAYARAKLARYRNVTIIEGDILDHIPENGTLFYLYHPFGRRTLEGFRDRLVDGVRGKKDVVVLYYNCEHLDVFAGDPQWDVEERDLTRAPTFFADLFHKLAVIRLRREALG